MTAVAPVPERAFQARDRDAPTMPLNAAAGGEAIAHRNDPTGRALELARSATPARRRPATPGQQGTQQYPTVQLASPAAVAAWYSCEHGGRQQHRRIAAVDGGCRAQKRPGHRRQ
jgi:hypothetical protein